MGTKIILALGTENHRLKPGMQARCMHDMHVSDLVTFFRRIWYIPQRSQCETRKFTAEASNYVYNFLDPGMYKSQIFLSPGLLSMK